MLVNLARHLLLAAGMVISALVVTTDPKAVNRTLDALASDSRLTLGEPTRNRVPVVAQTLSSRAGRSLFQELRDLDEVWSVDVVMVDFAEEHDDES